jgi:hypothetical protein
MTQLQRSVVWRQGAACLALLATAVTCGILAQHRSAGPDDVRILVQMVRSQNAELWLLERESSKLPRRFVSAQRLQVSELLNNAREDLAGLRIEQLDLDTYRREAQNHGLALSRAVRALERGERAGLSESIATAFQERQRALGTIEKKLQR